MKSENLALNIGINENLVWRQPFSGRPGLAIRILGDVTKERLDILRKADDILIQEIKQAGLYRKLWQSFAVLLPVKSVGCHGRQTHLCQLCSHSCGHIQ